MIATSELPLTSFSALTCDAILLSVLYAVLLVLYRIFLSPIRKVPG